MARPRSLPVLVALALAAIAPAAMRAGADATPARRIVSMNPSLTSILVALGASSSLVGVEEHAARLHPELASVPVVGGLFNPSVEAVVALQPDLVVFVPSAEQRDFRGRLDALGIDTLALPNISVAEILDSIASLGARTGRADAARSRADAIRSAFAEVQAAAAKRPPVRAVVVLQRDPLYVVAGGNFIDEMLRDAGVENVAAELAAPYPRAALEWLIAAGPEMILDASEGPPAAAAYWSRWPSIPAVAAARIVSLPPSVTYPGPYIDRSLRMIDARVRAANAPPRPRRPAGGRP